MCDSQYLPGSGEQRSIDRLTGELIGLARATDGNEHLITTVSTAAVVESLAAMNRPLPEDELERLMKLVEREKRNMVPDCFTCAAPCGKNSAYDLQRLSLADAQVRHLKNRLLQGIRTLAARIQDGGCRKEAAQRFLFKALIVIGMEDWNAEMLQPVVDELSGF